MKAGDFLNEIKRLSLTDANKKLEDACGIVGFLSYKEEIDELLEPVSEQEARDEFGDWQTNYQLACNVCQLMKEKGIRPQVVIEPTCGKGAFVLAALQTFESLELVYGIDIYKPYLNALKLNLLEKSFDSHRHNAKIKLFHSSIFDFDFKPIKEQCGQKNILVIGNPPWVTNSKLGSINSNNLPFKSNFKNQRGIDAITGKGNFDIAEYICNMMIREFGDTSTQLTFLIKNSVIKNLVYRQKSNQGNISNIEQYNIDAAKEFSVSVAASLLYLEFGSGKALECSVFDFYSRTKQYSYGWVGEKFVSNTEIYRKWQRFDNESQLEWWSGIKHDCSKVMELTKNAEGLFVNALNEIVDIEPELVYPLVKSSDISNGNITKTRKYVIVTQHSPSESTDYIARQYPKTYAYLISHADMLDGRGSIIYKKRPRFAMFGIGDYSFKKYKIAVSALYKIPRFALVEPIDGRPAMLDDTCYLIGFDNKEEAQMTLYLLNHTITKAFIETIMFSDAKRVINKDLLMRIDIAEVSETLADGHYSQSVPYPFDTFSKKLKVTHPQQLELF